MRRLVTHFLSHDMRIEREPLWIAWAAQVVTVVAFLAIAVLVIDPADDDPSAAVVAIEITLFALYCLCVAASAILGIKRLQARGRSAWWSLVALVPFGGALWYMREVGFLQGRVDGDKAASATPLT